MNKQEAIEFVEDISYSVPINSSVKYLREETVVNIINQIDESEKSIVPQYVAEWLNYCETKGFSLTVIFNGIGKQLYAYEFNGDVDKCTYWARNHQKEIAKAWLYGYEVEKEKLYTVFQLATKEYLFVKYNASELGTLEVNDDYAKKTKRYHFTQQKLEELQYWDNPAFEIKEVEL